MTVYLLHYERPIGDLDNPHGQAQHYVGSTSNLKQRLAAHRDGNGARLPQVFAELGIGFELARTWAGGKGRLRGIRMPGCFAQYAVGRGPWLEDYERKELDGYC